MKAKSTTRYTLAAGFYSRPHDNSPFVGVMICLAHNLLVYCTIKAGLTRYDFWCCEIV